MEVELIGSMQLEKDMSQCLHNYVPLQGFKWIPVSKVSVSVCSVFAVWLSKLVSASMKRKIFVPNKLHSYWKLRQAEHSRGSNMVWVGLCPLNLMLMYF